MEQGDLTVISLLIFSDSRLYCYDKFFNLVTGLMLRFDKLEITSVIRSLSPVRMECYEPMLHFFRASSWNSESGPYMELPSLCCKRACPSLHGRKREHARGKEVVPEVGKSAKQGYIHEHMFGDLEILDRYFLTVPTLETLKKLNGEGKGKHGDRHEDEEIPYSL